MAFPFRRMHLQKRGALPSTRPPCIFYCFTVACGVDWRWGRGWERKVVARKRGLFHHESFF